MQNAIWIMQRVVTVPWTPISVYGITTSCSRLFQLFFFFPALSRLPG